MVSDLDLQVAFLKSKYQDYEKFQEYRRNQSKKARQKGLDYVKSLQTECFFCQSKNNLSFLHKTNLHKVYSINQIYKNSKKSIDEEIAKCWCVCKECKDKINGRMMMPLPEFWT